MVDRIEGEITALQADLAQTLAWLKGTYLPSPLPQALENRFTDLVGRFDALREMIEDQEAAAAFERAKGQESIPDEMVGRLLDGENPIRVWRQHRELSLRSLAEKAGISASGLSDIETGKTEGRLSVLSRLADILGVGLEDLVPEVRDEAV